MAFFLRNLKFFIECSRNLDIIFIALSVLSFIILLFGIITIKFFLIYITVSILLIIINSFTRIIINVCNIKKNEKEIASYQDQIKIKK